LAVSGLVYLHWFSSGYPRLKMALGWVGIVSGVVSVYCMAMIYLLPTQTMGNSPLTVISFLMTAVLLGVMAVVTLLLNLSLIATLRQGDLSALPSWNFCLGS
jgi:DMSO reductase anchor subunit